MCAAASAAKRIISTAPIAKFGTTSTFAPPPAPAAASRSGSWSNPVVPTTAWTPASTAARTLPGAASGVVKSTMTSASPSTSASSTPSDGSARRSEEHTSELQSLAYLVCRLLLEKKNNKSERLRRVGRVRDWWHRVCVSLGRIDGLLHRLLRGRSLQV